MMELAESEDPEVAVPAQRRRPRGAVRQAARAGSPTTPTRWPSSTSCTRRRGTASRSPRTTPSTSTSCTSACSAASSSPSATGSSPRASSTQPDDVFYLYRDEVVDALTDGGDRRADRRRAAGELRAGGARSTPPTALGTPPPPPEVPDPFMDALVYRLLGIVPPEENTDPNVLKAVAGSPGVYTGTARVVPVARPGHRRPRGGRDHGRAR